MAKLTCRDIEKLLISKLPDIDHNDELVEDVSDDRIRIRMPFRPAPTSLVTTRST
jgi:hypothetical protein